MSNILTSFLKTLHVKYTSNYAEKLYEEHPHKNNLYGLSKMLEEYGIANVGVRINDKNIHSLETPFIAHIGLASEKKTRHITQELNSLKTTEEVFKALLEKQPYHSLMLRIHAFCSDIRKLRFVSAFLPILIVSHAQKCIHGLKNCCKRLVTNYVYI